MSMVLREAFRYQNFLTKLINEANGYLRKMNNIMDITEEHLRSKTQTEAEDEIKSNKEERPIKVDPDVVVQFLLQVLAEKEALAIAIVNAKKSHCEEFDVRMSINSTRTSIVDTLKFMAAFKNSEKINRGSAFAFNAEGNQIQYYYDIKTTTKIDFNRANIKKAIYKLSGDIDASSATIDYWLSSVPVNYTPPFHIDDTFEELVEQFDVMQRTAS